MAGKKDVRQVIETRLIEALKILGQQDREAETAAAAFLNMDPRTKTAVVSHVFGATERAVRQNMELEAQPGDTGGTGGIVLDPEAGEALSQLITATSQDTNYLINKGLKLLWEALQLQPALAE